MSRKTSAYARKRARSCAVVQRARGIAALVSTLKSGRAYTDNSAMPGEIEGAETIAEEAARKAELHVRVALDGLLRCERPSEPTLDFSRLKHALSVATIRALQVIYGSKRRHEREQVDLRELAPEQAQAIEVLHAGNQALNAAYDRWIASDGAHYGLDGPGRQALIDAVDLYVLILTNSTPAQMDRAHDEVLKIRARPMERGSQEVEA